MANNWINDIGFGTRFDKLVVIGDPVKTIRIDKSPWDDENDEKIINKVPVYPCRCACGQLCDVRADLLMGGTVTSCGCDTLNDTLISFRSLLELHNVTFKEDYKLVTSLKPFHFAIFKQNDETTLLGVIDFQTPSYGTRIGNEKKERVRKRMIYFRNKETYCKEHRIKYLVFSTSPLLYDGWYDTSLMGNEIAINDANLKHHWANGDPIQSQPPAQVLSDSWDELSANITSGLNISNNIHWYD